MDGGQQAQHIAQQVPAQLEQCVAEDAQRSLARLRAGVRQRGLFIDCGSNLGQGFSYFRRHYLLEDYDYVLIEPNPNCLPHLRALCDGLPGNVWIIAEAAGTGTGEARFFGLTENRSDPTAQGGSTVRDHNSLYYAADEENALTVRTFSLAGLIGSLRPQYGAMVLKLDIEGAEYAVLDDLIATGTHRLLDFSYIEFHSQYMAPPQSTHYRAKEMEIMLRLSADGVAYRRWI